MFTTGKLNMTFLIIVLLLCVTTSFALHRQCNAQDHRIYAARHAEFKSLFRSFGGLWTTRASYIEQIVDKVGLSESCASCYGDAYICGFYACPRQCITEGLKCDRCLERNACIEKCERCTGFVAL